MKNTVVVNLGWCVAKIEPDRPRLTILELARKISMEINEATGAKA